MRIKKGFTLAEILIVLMVIGVIATMTVPSLMKGVNEATYKTAYKKAYNAVTNIAAVEKISGQLPQTADATGALNFFASLNSNLSVKEYFPGIANPNANSVQGVMTSDQTAIAITVSDGSKTTQFGTGTSAFTDTISATKSSPWIITEDGLAYAVIVPTGATANTLCATKQQLLAVTDYKVAAENSCVVVFVDTNGLGKGPNVFESQVITGVSSDAKMNQFEGDRYYIFVGRDGVSAGPKHASVSGRLMADMK
jgi:prepilin-type N-terminal cleavage/methylation domain-containing protein